MGEAAVRNRAGLFAQNSSSGEIETEVHVLSNGPIAQLQESVLVHELFEARARCTPDELAVVHGAQTLTYAQLNRRANQLAGFLREQRGVGPDCLVGICLERGLEMVVGLLGILKAGGAYLPLDPHYPPQRLQRMLEDAAPRVVLTEGKLLEVLGTGPAERIALDEMMAKLSDPQDENLAARSLGLSAQNLIYVIYASGSTGLPKGTAMSHRSMVNLIEWHRRSFTDGQPRRVLQFAALSFDVAFQEIFSTLCTGDTLVLLDEWMRRDMQALTQLLCEQRIQRLFVSPLMLQSLAEFCASGVAIPTKHKKENTTSKQQHNKPQIIELFERLGTCRLHNHYGPTETHVVTALTLEGAPQRWPALPSIGRPISNAQIY